MKTLTLIRHAKSSWDDPFLDDVDRPLNHRGQHDLPLMCQRMVEHGPTPDRLIHSSALRTCLTADPLIEAFGLNQEQVESTGDIYEAAPEALIELIKRQHDRAQHLILVGHNPGMALLGLWLCADAPEHFPTSAIQQHTLSISHWSNLDTGCGRLIWHDYPKLHRHSSK